MNIRTSRPNNDRLEPLCAEASRILRPFCERHTVLRVSEIPVGWWVDPQLQIISVAFATIINGKTINVKKLFFFV
jgi:hypothetical protein